MIKDGSMPSDINVRDSTWNDGTALMCQAAKGTKEAMEWLLTRQPPAAVNLSDRYGKTAIMMAVINDHPDKVRLLLDNGADRDIPDIEGVTPLQVARSTNKGRVILILEVYFKNSSEVCKQLPRREEYLKEQMQIYLGGDKTRGEAVTKKNQATEEDLAVLYGLNKQATIGDNPHPQPNPEDKNNILWQKWKAWQRYIGYSKEQAVSEYLRKFDKLCPEFYLSSNEIASRYKLAENNEVFPVNFGQTYRNLPSLYHTEIDDSVISLMEMACSSVADWSFLYEDEGGLKVFEKKGAAMILRGDCIMRHSLLSIFDVIVNKKLSPVINKHLDLSETQCLLSDNTCIQYLKFKQVLLSRVRDMLVLHHWRLLRSGKVVITSFSLSLIDRKEEERLMPVDPKKSLVRAVLLLGGFVLTPLPGGITLVQHIVNSDFKGKSLAFISNKAATDQLKVVSNIRTYLDAEVKEKVKALSAATVPKTLSTEADFPALKRVAAMHQGSVYSNIGSIPEQLNSSGGVVGDDVDGGKRKASGGGSSSSSSSGGGGNNDRNDCIKINERRAGGDEVYIERTVFADEEKEMLVKSFVQNGGVCKSSADVISNWEGMIKDGFAPDINVRDSSWGGGTALMYQAVHGSIEAMEWLLTRQPPADVNLRNKFGSTAIMLAAYNNDQDKVCMLLEYGADRNIPNCEGESPLTYARRKNKYRIISILNNYYPKRSGRAIGLGETLTTTQRGGPRFFKDGKEKDNATRFVQNGGFGSSSYEIISRWEGMIKEGSLPSDINVQPSHCDGNTALIYQAIIGAKDAMKWLLTRQPPADVNLRNRDGLTAIMIAAISNNPEKVRLLLDYGADLDIPNNDGSTPLQEARSRNNSKVIPILEEGGYNPQQGGSTSAAAAAVVDVDKAKHGGGGGGGGEPFVKMLPPQQLPGGIGLLRDGKEKDNVTAFVHNGGYGKSSAEIISVWEGMIRDGSMPSDINVRDHNGNTALIYQASFRTLEAMEWLLTRQPPADVNLRNRDGNTAIKIAAILNDPDKARLLLDYGADRDIPDNKDVTPLQEARRRNNSKVIPILEEGYNPQQGGSTSAAAAAIVNVEEAKQGGRGGSLSSSQPLQKLLQGARCFQDEKVKKKEKDNITKFVRNAGGPIKSSSYIISIWKGMIKDGSMPLDINVRGTGLMTALIFQASCGSKEAMEWLLTRQPPADVNLRDREGNTAIMHAVILNDPNKVRFLLEYGADRDIPNKYSETPLQFAKKMQKVEVIPILEGYYPNQPKQGKASTIRKEVEEDWHGGGKDALTNNTMLLGSEGKSATSQLVQLVHQQGGSIDITADSKADRIAEMGFDKDACLIALRDADGNEEAAIECLIQAQVERERLGRVNDLNRSAGGKATTVIKPSSSPSMVIAPVVALETVDEVRVRAQLHKEKEEKEKEEKEERERADLVLLAEQVDDAFVSGRPMEIPYSILGSWTSSFSASNTVGRGGFGTVFKGVISYPSSLSSLPINASSLSLPGRGKLVAIKRVNADMLTSSTSFANIPSSPSSSSSSANQAAAEIERSLKKSVRSEIEVLSAFRSSPNIIRLIGYCMTDSSMSSSSSSSSSSIDHMCLVYEFAPLGDLMHFLLTRPKELFWQYRLRIAVGIATGLNFLHMNKANPAFHRDIKSSNVVLMHDFTPKIIDCGLAKYVPDNRATSSSTLTTTAGEGGGEVSAPATVFTNVAGLSAAGMRLGTPEYMCPEYMRDPTMQYDAMCEVFSFGIVMLELLTGKRNGAAKVFLQDDVGDLSVDEQVSSEWPLECVDEFRSLADTCVKKRKKRAPAMLPLLRQLSQMKARYDLPTSIEQALADQLRRTTAELASLRGEKEIAVQQSLVTFTCSVCYSDYQQSDGVSCSRAKGEGEAHTLCKACFNHAVITGSSESKLSQFTDHGRKIVCEFCFAETPRVISPYPNGVICRQCDDKTVAAFMKANTTAERKVVESGARAREQALERRIEETRLEGEVKLHAHNEKERLKASANLHRMRIIDTILTPKCPYADCKLSFHDWGQCFAVKCEFKDEKDSYVAGCMRYFCGWCMQSGFGTSSECHTHVRACGLSLRPGNYFGVAGRGNMEQHNQAQAPIRKQKIEQYLASISSSSSSDGNSSLSSQERQAILSLMQHSDLTPLGIQL